MPHLAFTWDPNKAASNLRKHHISFGEAQTVFLDERALVIPDHSAEEERFVILGMSRAARVPVVVHASARMEPSFESFPPAGRAPRNSNPTGRK